MEAEVTEQVNEKDVMSDANYRVAVKRLIDAEVKEIIEDEIKKASQEILDEQRRAIKQVVDEYKTVIREAVEEEKKAVWARVDELRKSINKLGLM